MRTYHALAVANSTIKNTIEKHSLISHLKLQKLLYFSHGWQLAISDGEIPLIEEQIVAWEYGPVIKSVYHAFKDFGKRPIDEYASLPSKKFKFMNYKPMIEDSDTEELLNRIWNIYGKLDANHLSKLTHLKDTPWYDSYESQSFNTPISNDKITKYFQSKMK